MTNPTVDVLSPEQAAAQKRANKASMKAAGYDFADEPPPQVAETQSQVTDWPAELSARQAQAKTRWRISVSGSGAWPNWPASLKLPKPKKPKP
jgi:hypothetical protein